MLEFVNVILGWWVGKVKGKDYFYVRLKFFEGRDYNICNFLFLGVCIVFYILVCVE